MFCEVYVHTAAKVILAMTTGAVAGVLATLVQFWNDLIVDSMSWSVPGHQTKLLARAFILNIPRCSSCSSPRILCFSGVGMTM